MRHFKLTIAYDGTDFHGWQMQGNRPTLQGEIVNVLQRLTQEKIFLHGAGRTDAGVHALGQVASFKTQSGLSAQEFQRALNALRPQAIRIVGAAQDLPLSLVPRKSRASDALAVRLALSIPAG